jgi:hypothetical protein
VQNRFACGFLCSTIFPVLQSKVSVSDRANIRIFLKTNIFSGVNEKSKKLSIAAKRPRAGWDEVHLFKLLNFMCAFALIFYDRVAIIYK